MKTGASLNRGGSKQNYGTPPEFIEAVVKRFGPLNVDLAAEAGNAICEHYFTKEDDSLAQDWNLQIGRLWLNPPYENIGKWAKKCLDSRKQILMLIPASVGSNYFRDYIFGHCEVYFLNGRITFNGCTQPYPKDCMLCVYGGSIKTEIWKWKA